MRPDLRILSYALAATWIFTFSTHCDDTVPAETGAPAAQQDNTKEDEAHAEPQPAPPETPSLELARVALSPELRDVLERLPEAQQEPFLSLSTRGQQLFVTLPDEGRALLARAAQADGFASRAALAALLEIEPALATELGSIRRRVERATPLIGQSTGRHHDRRVTRLTALAPDDSLSPPGFLALSERGGAVAYRFEHANEAFVLHGALDASNATPRAASMDCSGRFWLTQESNDSVALWFEDTSQIARRLVEQQRIPGEHFVRSSCQRNAGGWGWDRSHGWVITWSRTGEIAMHVLHDHRDPLDDGTPALTFATRKPLQATALAADDRAFVAHGNGWLQIWQLPQIEAHGTPTGAQAELLHELEIGEQGYDRVALSGPWLLALERIGGLTDTTLHIYDTRNFTATPRTLTLPATLDLTLSEDRQLLATGHWDGSARVYAIDPATGVPAPLARLPHDKAVRRVAFSFDGRWIATVTRSNLAPAEDDRVRWWELR